MDEIDKAVQKVVEREALKAKKAGISETELEKIIGNAITKAIAELSKAVFSDCKKRLPEMISEYAELESGFRERNYQRWKDGFDLLQMLIVTSQETGEAINIAEREKAYRTQDWKLEALINIHARSVLVAREIFSLMKNGFPDGALGRWRTLHELSVIALFLSQHQKIVSRRYIAHRHIEAFKAAKQYREHQKRANLKAPRDKEFEEISQINDLVVAEFGKEIARDWGWAKPELKGSPNFSELEKSVRMDHWRPRYKWACAE
ncbi:DUF5677 domain-containing protein [Chelativorans sp. J32]|uniref:DUF5677 domain-containing protein n=1 Tax=Chelativorans sp. J32 TaxID=935840 RepID=UPI0004887B29|nr:DUF5677 domain-containing protein [Chelativorans sp. J32]